MSTSTRRPATTQPPPPGPLEDGVYQYQWRGTLLSRVRDAFRNAGHSNEWLPSRINTAIRIGIGFGWWVVPGRVAPRDQVDFVENVVQPLINEIVSREAELGAGNLFALLKQVETMFRAGCVAAPANPVGAAQQASAIKKRMEDMILRWQSKRLAYNISKSLGLGAILVFIALWSESKTATVNRMVINLIWTAAVCILADAVSMAGLARVETMADYDKKKHLLDLSLLRVILLAITVELFALLCWQGGIQFRIGDLDSAKFATNRWVAIAIGAAGGFLGSDMTRIIVGAFRKSAGRR